MTDAGASERLKGAPDPEDSRKPDGPTEVHKRSWLYVLRKTAREFTADQCTDIAASLTYYAVLSIFPAFIALISILGVMGNGQDAVDTLLGVLSGVVPGSALNVIRGPLEGFADSPAAGFALISGIVLAIWSASGYVGAFSRASNRIYEIDEGRPVWKLKPVQLLITIIGLALILVIVLLLLVSGPVADEVGKLFGAGEAFTVIWDIAKWPVIAAILVFLVAVLYYMTPNAKQPKFRWISMGAVLALVILAIATLGFGLYVANFSNYDKTYGSLGGVIVFLLWLWIANLAILFGAEFDAELERGRQLQAGIAAERDIQLPPRDTKKTEKREKAEEKDLAEARRIRRQHGAS